ncbi:hypothetical protein QVD17_26633 [Tagetes erecta]|uniref:BHLH domain-containing protein n=1 Tax=Tagetes erecta TaxID=13708 RepID=A0AAD8K6Z7_TARER|nr:hypothetical protein QVD17_26633 [Tagetes erecta]
MDKEVSGEGSRRPLLASNENFHEETIRGGTKSIIDPNIRQHEAGVEQKCKGKAIDVGNELGDEKKRKRYCQPETRVSAERKRRSTETKLYADLLAMLPQISTKGHKIKILEEAISTIKSLEETLHGLEKQKQDRQLHGASQSHDNNTQAPDLLINNGEPTMNVDTISDQSSYGFKTLASPNVTLSVCGANAFINICSEKIPELFSTICYILENHNLDVLYIEISSDRAKSMYMIRVRHDVRPELANGFTNEEMCEEAVEQIAQLLALHN